MKGAIRESDIAVIGLGGGGSRIVSQLATVLPPGPRFLAIDTDVRSIEDCTLAAKLQIGPEHTDGLGAGGHLSLGRLAAEEDIEKIREAIGDRRLVLAAVGMGGGTGTGAAPVVLEAVRNAGAVAIAFGTMPFSLEGQARRHQAVEAVAEIRDAADALIMVPNDRLFEGVEDLSLAQMFDQANAMLGSGMAAFWKLLTKPGYIHLDLADLKRIVEKSGGTCSLSYGSARGEGRAVEAARIALEGPLTEHGRRVAEAKALLVSIVGGDDMRLAEVGTVMDAIGEKTRPEVHTFMGTIIDNQVHDGEFSVMLLIAEQFVETEPPMPAVRPVAAPAPPGGKRRRRRTGAAKSELQQGDLGLDISPARGRFKDVEPTILGGQDLDIPTYLRRGLPLER